MFIYFCFSPLCSLCSSVSLAHFSSISLSLAISYGMFSVVLVVAVCLSCVLFCPALAAESKWKISFQNIFCHLRNNNFVCFLFFLYYSLAEQCYCLSHSVCVCVCENRLLCVQFDFYTFIAVVVGAIEEMSFSFQLMCLMASVFTTCPTVHTHTNTHTYIHILIHR